MVTYRGFGQHRVGADGDWHLDPDPGAPNPYVAPTTGRARFFRIVTLRTEVWASEIVRAARSQTWEVDC